MITAVGARERQVAIALAAARQLQVLRESVASRRAEALTASGQLVFSLQVPEQTFPRHYVALRAAQEPS
jgi:hypothetical protein